MGDAVGTDKVSLLSAVGLNVEVSVLHSHPVSTLYYICTLYPRLSCIH